MIGNQSSTVNRTIIKAISSDATWGGIHLHGGGKNSNMPLKRLLYLQCTVVPAKSESDPHDRINTHVIYRLALVQVECTRYCLTHNFKQNMVSLSFLAGRTVNMCPV